MGASSITLLALMLAGALASWVAGAVFFARALPGSTRPPRAGLRWLSVMLWPFGLWRIKDTGREEAALANKAVIVFLVLVTLAATTISVATNLNRVMRQ